MKSDSLSFSRSSCKGVATWSLCLLVAALTPITQAQEEPPPIRTNLYMLLVRNETSTMVVAPDDAPVKTSRGVSWISDSGAVSTQLRSGFIQGPFDYHGSPNFTIGRENAGTSEIPIIGETQCLLSNAQNQLILLFPRSATDLRVSHIIPVDLPNLKSEKNQVFILNVNPEKLAVKISGAEAPLIVDSMQPTLIPEALCQNTMLLRLELATRAEQGEWKRIPGTRVMLGSENAQIVLVHPSFGGRKQWIVRTLALNN